MNQQSDDTRKLFAYLLLTCKNVSLYPEGHSISRHSIEQFQEMLVSHIRHYGDLRIEIEKDRVICQGVEVHKGSSEEGSLPFTLFRDGIRWLEFTEGIKLEETREVLFMIHRYSVLTTEPTGDIVTAFWEARFEHVLYKADDFVSENTAEQIDSLDEWDARHAPEDTEKNTEDQPWPPVDSDRDTTPSGTPPLNPDDFLLTSQEKIELQEMIFREEQASISEHLNMLLDMLLQFQEEKDFNIVLGVLAEEFDISYRSQNFDAALIILDGLRKILDSGNVPVSGVHLIESFYKDISSDSKSLKPLEETWSKLNAKQIETLKEIFRHLNPKAAYTLVHFLLLGQPSQLEKIVEDSVINLARQDLSCLESLVNNPDERIAEKLVSILSRLEGDGSFKFLMRLARHASATVRRLAIKEIAQSHRNQIQTTFEFIDDPDAAVRQVILAQMGQSRSEVAENFLIKYLQDRNFSASQNEHVIECFRTLGKCGSLRSVSFLSKTLLQKKWTAGLRKSAYREGAALALVALKIPEARKVIETVGRSFYPGLRSIARKVGKEFFQKTKGVE